MIVSHPAVAYMQFRTIFLIPLLGSDVPRPYSEDMGRALYGPLASPASIWQMHAKLTFFLTAALNYQAWPDLTDNRFGTIDGGVLRYARM